MVRVRISGEEGRIGADEVRRIPEEYPEAHYCLCGPKAYQEFVEGHLKAARVSHERIHIEEFTPVGPRPEAAGQKPEALDRVPVLVGASLLAAFLLQAAMGLQWP